MFRKGFARKKQKKKKTIIIINYSVQFYDTSMSLSQNFGKIAVHKGKSFQLEHAKYQIAEKENT